MLDVDHFFWENPPWGDGKQKYRLGLKPISEDEWLNRKIGPNLYSHKKELLDLSLIHISEPTRRS